MARADPLASAGYCLALLVVGVPLFDLASRHLLPRGPSNDDSSGAVRFVHVPKTGGGAVVTHLRLRGGCPAMDGGGHDVTERTALERSQVPLIVLREPLSRLQSAFEYWRKGSEVHAPRASAQVAQVQRELLAALPDFGAFLDGFTNRSSHRRHAAVLQLLRMPHHLSEHAWDAHFKPQVQWVDRESERSVFVCYERAQLGRRLQCVVDERQDLLKGCNFSALSLVNYTPRRAKATAMQQLSGPQRRAIRALYARDFELYERYCGTCHRACACCHARGKGRPVVASCSQKLHGGGAAARRRVQLRQRRPPERIV